MKNNNFDLISQTKRKWILDLTVKAKLQKLQKKIYEINLCKLRLGKDFYAHTKTMNQKTKKIKPQIAETHYLIKDL